MKVKSPLLNALLTTTILSIVGTFSPIPAQAQEGQLNKPPGKVFIYARDMSGAVIYRMFDKTHWTGWVSLGGVTQGSPDACSPNPGEMIIFVRGGGAASGQLFFKRTDAIHFEERSTVWEPFRTLVSSDPGAVCRSGGQVDVFARGASDAAVWQAWYANGDWANRYSGGIGGKTLGGGINGGPDACSWGGQRLDVFARGTDNYIWHKYRDEQGAWHEWESLGGMRMTSDPSAVARSSGQMSVFARGENNQIWTKTYISDDRWGPWLSLGGTLAGGPDATRTADSRIDVFARGARGEVLHTSVTFKGNFPDIKNVPAWYDLGLGGHIITADPSAVGVNW